MTTTTHGDLRRLAAALAALAVTLAGAALASPAGAATSDAGHRLSRSAPRDTSPDPASLPLPDAGRRGTLVIHKHASPLVSDTPGDGAELTPGLDESTAIDGVEFTVAPVPGIVLTTTAGWEAGAKLTIEEALNRVQSQQASGAPVASSTRNGRAATFDDLDLGVYVVQETTTPLGVVAADPFLVFLPMTNPEGTGWLYEVHAYPKNDTVLVTKTVDDSRAFVLGDEVVWTITADIPKSGLLDDGYTITDVLSENLAYVTAEVQLGTQTLGQNDCEVSHDEDTGKVTVAFTPSGIDKLNTDKLNEGTSDLQVTVKITTRVERSGEIGNSAGLDIVTATTTRGAHVDSGEVETKWGGFLLVKSDQNGNLLKGAQFNVAATQEDALNGVFLLGSAVTTDEDGSASIDGLRYSDYGNGVPLGAAPTEPTSEPTESAAPVERLYWLVETTAPSGYSLLAEPVPVKVTGQVGDGAPIEVVNVLKPHLPLTGGAGAVALTVAGVVVLVSSGGVLARRRRQSAQA